MGRKRKAANVAGATADAPENLNPPTEIVAPQPTMQTKSTGLFYRNKAWGTTRRSQRLLNTPARNREIEPVLEEINLCQSEKEDEPDVEEDPVEPMSAERSLEEKINYLVVQAVQELKCKATERHFQSEIHADNITYKSLYIESQKKIEALTNEKNELLKKLDVALGKVEAYGEANRVCLEALGKLKDFSVMSHLAKTTETALNLSSQAIMHSGVSSPDGIGVPRAAADLQTYAKRKKRAKGDKGN